MQSEDPIKETKEEEGNVERKDNFTKVKKEENIKRWMMSKLKIHIGQVLKASGNSHWYPWQE